MFVCLFVSTGFHRRGEFTNNRNNQGGINSYIYAVGSYFNFDSLWWCQIVYFSNQNVIET